MKINAVPHEPSQDLMRLSGDLEDCAAHLECHAQWNSALFDAIHKITKVSLLDAKPLDVGDRETVSQLASIGHHLAENAYSVACDYERKAVNSKNGQTA